MALSVKNSFDSRWGCVALLRFYRTAFETKERLVMRSFLILPNWQSFHSWQDIPRTCDASLEKLTGKRVPTEKDRGGWKWSSASRTFAIGTLEVPEKLALKKRSYAKRPSAYLIFRTAFSST